METDNKGKESTALVATLAHDKELGEIFVKSGFFSDAKDQSQAIVKILAGREVGLQPIEAMTNINIIKGKISFGANMMASAVKKHPNYDYRVKDHTDTECVIEFFEITYSLKDRMPDREKIGTSSFTIKDAERIKHWDSKKAKDVSLADGDSWKNYPKAMLFARAMSAGVRYYCPDVFGHTPVYVPEEMGEEVDEEGEPINVTPPPSKQPKVKQCSECGNAIPNDNESGLCALCLDSGNAIQEADFEERPTIPPVQDAEHDDVYDTIGTAFENLGDGEPEPDKGEEEVDTSMAGEEGCEHINEDQPNCEVCGELADEEMNGKNLCAEHANKEEDKTSITLSIPEGIINDVMKPRNVLDAIMDYATKNGLSNVVKPVLVKHYKKYDDDSRYPYHIPESKVIKIVEELTGIKTKKAEKVKKCKSCEKRITEPEAEEQTNDDDEPLCLSCWLKFNG